MSEEKSVPLSTHTQIINIMAFVRLAVWDLDSFVTTNKVTFNVEICVFVHQYQSF